MKKIILSAAMLAFTIGAAYAQSGSLYIGGAAGFGSGERASSATVGGTTTTSKVTASSWNVGPEVGYFLADDMSVGLALGVGGDSDNTPSAVGSSKDESSNFGATVYFRKFFKVADSFSTFGGVNVGLGSGAGKSTFTPTSGSSVESGKFTTSSLGANLNFGFAWAPSAKWTVVGSMGVLGYNSDSRVNDDAVKSTTTNSGFGLSINTLGNPVNVGIYYTVN
jgi:hypothetical protein